jgi:hypothetical protein
MKRAYFTIVYVVLSLGAILLPSGATLPWSGTGGG